VRAKRGDIAGGELAPVGEDGGQRCTDFAGSQLQQSVARAARKRCLQALRYLRVERKGVILLCQREASMRSENGSERRRRHTPALFTR